MALSKKTYYGSGRVYTFDFDAEKFPKIADIKNITEPEAAAVIKFIDENMTADNQIGYLKDGYQISVSTSNLSDKSDLGEMKVDAITDEKATAQFKLFNANGETIAKQYPTAEHGTDTASGFSFTQVGGLNNLDETIHVIIFRHSDKKYGDTVTISAGKNTSGFDAVWKQDSVTPFPCTYELEPYDDDGHFLIIADCKAGHVWAIDSTGTETV